MLNHKTIFKQKSKILLTIICIFGLAFSYSCSCRNDDKFGSTGDFTATLNTMDSITDLIVKSDNNTNSVVKILFNSEQNISAAKIISVKTKEGKTDVGLTTDNIKYNLATKELELGANGETAKTIATKLPNSGDKSIIVLSIELTSDSANLNNTTTTVDVDVNLMKAIKLNYDKIHTDIFKNVGIGGQIIENEKLSFSFTDTSASYKNDEISIKNIGNAEDNTTYTPVAFVTKANGATYFGHKSDIYSSAKVTYQDGSIGSGTVAIFFVEFIYQPKYEFDTTKFTLKVDIANNGKGKWDTTGS